MKNMEEKEKSKTNNNSLFLDERISSREMTADARHSRKQCVVK